MPYDALDPQPDASLDRLRRRVHEQGAQAQALRRRHRERAAASDERRSGVLRRIDRARREAGLP